jgi:hypothetical protein
LISKSLGWGCALAFFVDTLHGVARTALYQSAFMVPLDIMTRWYLQQRYLDACRRVYEALSGVERRGSRRGECRCVKSEATDVARGSKFTSKWVDFIALAHVTSTIGKSVWPHRITGSLNGSCHSEQVMLYFHLFSAVNRQKRKWGAIGGGADVSGVN